MFRAPRLIASLAAVLLAGWVVAGDAVDPVFIFPDFGRLAVEPAPALPGNLQPGRDAPRAPALAGAWRVGWDDYKTLVVVGDGSGSFRPAWVVTYDSAGAVAVAYRARAYLDKDGTLHIDARHAIIVGPQRDNWSADSFALTEAGPVYTLDDHNRSNSGVVVERLDPKQRADYQRLLGMAQAIVGDSI